MIQSRILQHACGFALILSTLTPHAAADEQQTTFQEILKVAGLGPEVLAQFSAGPDDRNENWHDEDWQLLVQLLYRLRQHSAAELRDWTTVAQPQRWRANPQGNVGGLFELRGVAESVEQLSLPQELREIHELPSLFRCHVRLEDSADSVVVLTAKVPRRWSVGDSLAEPVRVRGVLLRVQPVSDEQLPIAMLLTDYLAWFPTTGVSTGQLLLASAGMDVALLDEVVHRQDFVRAEVSREGEAFYACLAALGRIDQGQVTTLARENVERVAERWKALQPTLRRKHETLKTELAGADDQGRTRLQEEIAAARKQRGIAAAVIARAERGQSSVAPLFLQPEEEVGELVQLEGTARRAVRIATPDQSEMKEYFEVEVFTADSQNLPVVCCVDRLPQGFPVGDAIREPVRISGLFFKSWRYRTRNVVDGPGETNRQQQLYTPVVLGVAPIWLTNTVQRESRWGLVGGMAFLAVLVVAWVSLTRLARRDRQARVRRRQDEKPGF